MALRLAVRVLRIEQLRGCSSTMVVASRYQCARYLHHHRAIAPMPTLLQAPHNHLQQQRIMVKMTRPVGGSICSITAPVSSSIRASFSSSSSESATPQAPPTSTNNNNDAPSLPEIDQARVLLREGEARKALAPLDRAAQVLGFLPDSNAVIR